MNLYSIRADIGGGSYIGQEKSFSPTDAIIKWLKNLDALIIMSCDIETKPVIEKLEKGKDEVEIKETYKNMWEIDVKKDSGNEIYVFNVVKTVES